jgi:3',5'-cyclic AMP phosphodiesterase CpdA
MRTIAHISDLHFGRHSAAVATALIRSINDHRPHVVALSGDLTQRARTVEFAAARDFLTRLPQPKILVPGNHDVPLYNIFSRFLRPFTKYNHYLAAMGQPDNFYNDEEIAVLGMNTARRFTRKNGRVSLEQMQHIADVIGNLPSGIFKILVTHHPLANPEGAPTLELAGRAVRAVSAMKTAGVHLLLSGHHHRAVSGGNAELEGGGSILVLHAGTAISTRMRGGSANSYNLIQIAGTAVLVSLMEHVESEFRETSVSYYSFEGERWNKAK